ncbi:hypothetical protein Tco_0227627 [Tanacetum coccineum]
MSSNSTAPLSPDHPLTNASPILVPFLCRSARMVVCVLPAMSPGLCASIADVVAMSDSAFLKDDDEEEEGDDEEDKEIEESLDSDSGSEDAEDEGPTAEEEDPAAGDEGLAAGDEGPSMRDKSLSVGGGEVRVLDLYQSLRDQRRSQHLATPFQTSPSPEWSSGSLPVSPTPSIVPSPISSPIRPLTVPSLIASPAMAETEGFLTELGARVEMQRGLICDHTVRFGELLPALFKRYDRDIGELFTRSGAVRDEIFSYRYRFRSLEHKKERVTATFGAIWRPVLAWRTVAPTDCKGEAGTVVIWLRLLIVEERARSLRGDV